mmetsp:Transcript_17813/g.38859  ORF Transcript_17813/g.38859 Transcript_17813/m.38859 type:complete len:231 (+) Transcript_17813:888-1580(+)
MRHTFSVQPVSRTATPSMRAMMAFATRDGNVRSRLSLRFLRHPHTRSRSFASMCSSILGMSAGSFCKSASMVTKTRPCACLIPAARAAVWPKLRRKIMVVRSSRSADIAFNSCVLPSVDPSSTQIISYRKLFSFMTLATDSMSNGRFFNSLYTAITMETPLAATGSKGPSFSSYSTSVVHIVSFQLALHPLRGVIDVEENEPPLKGTWVRAWRVARVCGNPRREVSVVDL